MEKYILNLLRENSRVIIPEFGAFIIRQQNPPEIAFNSFLTFNDGILTEYIGHIEGISFHEASAKVAEYSEKLNSELKLHNRLTFNEIGWVWLDESGEKQFTSLKGGERTEPETPAPLRDLDTILKESELSEKKQSEPLPESQVFQTADQTPFVLDDTLKEVDIDATKDDLLKKTPEDSSVHEDNASESFSLEEPVISEPETPGTKKAPEDSESKILIKPKIDLSESLQEVQKGASVSEPEAPKVGIKFKHEMPPEETVIARDYGTLESQNNMTSAAQDAQMPTVETAVPGSVKDEQKKPLDEDWQEIESRPVSMPKKVKEKRKHNWVVPVSIIGSVIILAAAAWFLFPELVNKIIPREKQSQVEVSPGVEIPENDKINTSEPEYTDEQITGQETEQGIDENETPAQKEITSAPADDQGPLKKYYIVAGRFKSQQNAERFSAELRSKGFNAEYFAAEDNLYTVSFNSFTSRESAEAEMSRIRKSIEPKAWILYY